MPKKKGISYERRFGETFLFTLSPQNPANTIPPQYANMGSVFNLEKNEVGCGDILGYHIQKLHGKQTIWDFMGSRIILSNPLKYASNTLEVNMTLMDSNNSKYIPTIEEPERDNSISIPKN